MFLFTATASHDFPKSLLWCFVVAEFDQHIDQQYLQNSKLFLLTILLWSAICYIFPYRYHTNESFS